MSVTSHFTRQTKRLFLIVIAIQIVWFALFFLLFEGSNWTIYNDSNDYISIANSIVHDQMFATDDASPDGSRTPLYPLLIAALGTNIGVLIVLQHIFAACISMMLYQVGTVLRRPRVGWWAAILFAIEPTVAVWTNQAVTENFFTLIFMGGSLSLLFGLLRQQPRYIYLASFLFGLSALARPVALLFIIPLLGFLLAWKYIATLRWQVIGVSIILFALAVAPWFARNRYVFDAWGFATVSMIVANAEATVVLTAHESEVKARAIIDKFAMLDILVATDKFNGPFDHNPQSNSVALSRFRETLRAYPIALVGQHLSGLRGFYTGSYYQYYADIVNRRTPGLAGFTRAGVWVGAFVWIATPLLALIGAVVQLRQYRTKEERLALAYLIGTILYFGLITGQGGNDRFRYPVVGLMFFFAISGLFFIRDRLVHAQNHS
jgi:4-amino-4-deoxy-L-arabinose transferase-like glycosyltransferase